MVKINTWNLILDNGYIPTLDTIIFYDSPDSVRFDTPGTVDQRIGGIAASSDMVSAPNTQYTLSGRVKAQGVLGTGAPVLRLVEYDAVGAWITATAIIFDRGTYEWLLKSANITTGPNTASIAVTSFLDNSYGTYWLDDVNISTVISSGILESISVIASPTPTTQYDTEITFTGTGVGRLDIYKNNVIQGSILQTPTGTWSFKDNFLFGIGTWTIRVFDGTKSLSATVTITPQICPVLSATVSISPTTIVSGGIINYTSTASGGISTDDGYGHEIQIDGNTVYNTGLRNAAMVSGTVQLVGILQGQHNVTSRITDGCVPTHQIAISPQIALIVSPICPTISVQLS